MAKATGLGSQFRGKIGNYVGYLTKTKAGTYSQNVKAYQPVVSNPQSYAQALARVPIAPVQRVCSALLPLIQRGFEGIAYGDASKNEFLSLNLKRFAGPYIEKGDPINPPGNMIISRGSLSNVPMSVYIDGLHNNVMEIDGKARTTQNNANVAQLTTQLINAFPTLRLGDQLTVVYCLLKDSQYVWGYYSFYLDNHDTSVFTSPFSVSLYNNTNIKLMFGDSRVVGEIVAGAIVRSSVYGSTSFRRSTTYLQLNPNNAQYLSVADMRKAVASYRDGNADPDWEDDPTPLYQQIASLVAVDITEEMVTAEGWAAIQEAGVTFQCLGYVTKGGEVGIFFEIYAAGDPQTLLGLDGGEEITKDGHTLLDLEMNPNYLPSVQYDSSYGVIV